MLDGVKFNAGLTKARADNLYIAKASGSIVSGELGNSVVLSGNIASGQIGTTHLASGVIPTSIALTSGQVTSGFLGNNSVVSGSIASGQVASGHLASGFINSLPQGTVTNVLGTSGLTGQVVGSGIISVASGGINSGMLASGLLSNLTFNLTSGIIQSGHIGNDAVNSGNISSGQVASGHLASGFISSLSQGTVTNVLGTSGLTGQVTGSGIISVASGGINSGHLASGLINSLPQGTVTNVAGVGALTGTVTSSGTISVASGGINSGMMASGFINSLPQGTVTNVLGTSGLTGQVTGSGIISVASGGINSGMLASGLLSNLTFNLTSGIIQSGHIGNAAVLSGNIGSGQIASGHLASGLIGPVLSGAIASGAVGFPHLANASVRSGTIGSGQVASGHLASGLLANLATGTVTSVAGVSGLVGTVTTSGIISIGSGAINSGMISSGTIPTPFTLTSGIIQSGHIGNSAVLSGNVGSGQIASGHLASGFIANLATGGTVTNVAGVSGLIGTVTNSGLISIASGGVNSGMLASGFIANLATGGTVTNVAGVSGLVGTVTGSGIISVGSGGINSGMLASGLLFNAVGQPGGWTIPYAFAGNTVFPSISGTLFFDNANPALATGVVPSAYNFYGASVSGVLTQVTAGSWVRIFKVNDPTAFVYGKLTSNTYSAGFALVWTSPQATAGTFASGDALGFSVSPSSPYSSGQVTSGFIGNNSVTSGNIASGQIASGHLASGLLSNISIVLTSGIIQSGHIGNNAVNSGNISSGAVGFPHLANASVLSGTIGSGQIASGHLASGLIGPVLSGAIASGAVGFPHLANASVRSGTIGSGQVASGHLASGLLAGITVAITSGQIGSGLLGNNSVVSGSIASGQISIYNFASGATINRSQFVAPFVSGSSWTAITEEIISGFRAVAISKSGNIRIAMASVSGRMPAIGIVADNVTSGIQANVYTVGNFQLTSGMADYSGYLGQPVYVGKSGQVVTANSSFNSGGFTSGSTVQTIGNVKTSGGIVANLSLQQNASITPPVPSICGTRNLLLKNDNNTPTTKLDLSFDEAILQDSNGNTFRAGYVEPGFITAGPIVIDCATTGVNALDTGSLANATWYYVYIISNGNTVAGLASTSNTSPTMPAGYTYKFLVGAVRTAGSADFVTFHQIGNRTFVEQTNIFSGTFGSTTYASQDISTYVPVTATVGLGLMGPDYASTGYGMAVAGNSLGVGECFTAGNASSVTLDGYSLGCPWRVPLITAQTIWWKTGITGTITFRLDVTGWEYSSMIG